MSTGCSGWWPRDVNGAEVSAGRRNNSSYPCHVLRGGRALVDEDVDDVGSGALAQTSEAPASGPCAVSAQPTAMSKGEGRAPTRRRAQAARTGRAWYHDRVRFNASDW